MAAYLALQILRDKLDYKTILGHPLYAGFKEDVDGILVAEGRQDLIVEI